jgi:hypothetical protein
MDERIVGVNRLVSERRTSLDVSGITTLAFSLQERRSAEQKQIKRSGLTV